MASGYRYSSSVSANVSLSHLPFRMSHSRAGKSEVDVYEFLIMVEDELPPAMLERLDDAIQLAGKIARHGGIYIVLIHPDVNAEKLEFQERLADAVSADAWFGSLAQLGKWWRQRRGVGIALAKVPAGVVVRSTNARAVVADLSAGANTLTLRRSDGG